MKYSASLINEYPFNHKKEIEYLELLINRLREINDE
jgi:hypothetical protein